MIERILALLAEKEITALKLTSDLGMSSGIVTQWKKGLQKPSTDAIIKIANYFNVSTDYLLTGKESDSPMPTVNVCGLTPENVEEVKRYVDYLRSKQ